ncbi:MAG TPA: hypothetical protein VH934_14010 [Xanthobacteraceae bacterium]|jgi:hypothetical protein
MAERDIDALVLQNNNDWLGGYVRWFTDTPLSNGCCAWLDTFPQCPRSREPEVTRAWQHSDWQREEAYKKGSPRARDPKPDDSCCVEVRAQRIDTVRVEAHIHLTSPVAAGARECLPPAPAPPGSFADRPPHRPVP